MTPPCGARGDLEFVRHGVGQNRQRVIAGGREWVRKSLQHTDIGVEHGAGLAVQQFRCAVDGGPERHPDGLVAQAHAQQRGGRRGAGANQRDRRTGAFGCARPGLSSTPSKSVGGLGDVGVGGQPRVVVTPDLRVHPQLAQILDQVEHEAVVVVDDQNLHQARLLGYFGVMAPGLRAPSSVAHGPGRLGEASSAPARCARPVRPRRGVLRCNPTRTAPRTACRG